MTEGSRWRGWSERQQDEEPEWQEGLCGISLLPLEHLSDLHVAPWVQEKPCLVPPLPALTYALRHLGHTPSNINTNVGLVSKP